MTVVLVDIWVYTPFMMILLLAGLRALPRQPFEAAELDGVPATFVFFRITLPMLAEFLMVLWAITFVLSNLFIRQWLKLREQARGHG